jgi:hypothetical protein
MFEGLGAPERCRHVQPAGGACRVPRPHAAPLCGQVHRRVHNHSQYIGTGTVGQCGCMWVDRHARRLVCKSRSVLTQRARSQVVGMSHASAEACDDFLCVSKLSVCLGQPGELVHRVLWPVAYWCCFSRFVTLQSACVAHATLACCS